ncbi:MAG: hypothetical protein VYC47_05655 [Verrucomicrobiota bacterium]|nr:hypothetical protein [Verrucomicrobiota bacterium]
MTTGMTAGNTPRKLCYTPSLPEVTPPVSQKVALGPGLPWLPARHNLVTEGTNPPGAWPSGRTHP